MKVKNELGYTDWLRDTLADDFRSSGMISTAQEFEKCAAIIDALEEKIKRVRKSTRNTKE